MRILQVGKYYPPVRGGIENNVHALSTGLAERHQVTTLVFNTRRASVREAMDGVEVVRAGSLGRVLSTEIAPGYVSQARRLHADLVHLHTPNPLGELGVWLRRNAGALVVTHHSDVIRQRSLRFAYGPVLSAVLRRADRIIVYTRRYMESSETLRPFRDKCVFIPHGLDLREFGATPEIESKVRKLRERHGSRIVLFVGRLVYYKGVDVLLEAVRDLDAVVIVAGKGPMLDALRQKARDLGVDGRARFLGEVTHEDKVALYRAAAVFALPCTHRSEAFGQVQVEAQACARPVITTDIDSGVPEVTVGGETGLVVPPSDAGALARAIREILSNPDRARSMGEAGRRRAETVYSRETMLRDTFALFDEVARERGLDGNAPAAPAPR